MVDCLRHRVRPPEGLVNGEAADSADLLGGINDPLVFIELGTVCSVTVWSECFCHVSSSSSTAYTVHSMQESGIHLDSDIWNMDRNVSDPAPAYVPCKYRSIY